MTIDEAHAFLGINKTQTLQEITNKYLKYTKVNPYVTYIQWLEQEVIIQSISNKLSLTTEELFRKLNMSREELIGQYFGNSNVKTKNV